MEPATAAAGDRNENARTATQEGGRDLSQDPDPTAPVLWADRQRKRWPLPSLMSGMAAAELVREGAIASRGDFGRVVTEAWHASTGIGDAKLISGGPLAARR